MTDVNTQIMPEVSGVTHSTKSRLAATGGILGALAASTCCIVPLVLFSLGISGAWIGQLTALEPYKPYFMVITVGFLGYGFWLVYRRPETACAEGEACARPLPNRLVKTGLWFAAALVILAFAWPVIVPFILN